MLELRHVMNERMREVGMSRSDLARATNTDRAGVTRWLAGTHIPSSRKLRAIATALDMPVADLFSAREVSLLARQPVGQG